MKNPSKQEQPKPEQRQICGRFLKPNQPGKMMIPATLNLPPEHRQQKSTGPADDKFSNEEMLTKLINIRASRVKRLRR